MSELGQKIQVASSVNRNLSSSFLVTIIQCSNQILFADVNLLIRKQS